MNIILHIAHILAYAYFLTTLLVLPVYILLQVLYIFITDTLTFYWGDGYIHLKSTSSIIITILNYEKSEFVYIPTMVYMVRDDKLRLEIYMFYYVIIIKI